MVDVVLYFQVHQPHRLRHYTAFDTDPFYFEDDQNGEICKRVAERCYIPATRVLIDLARAHAGRFRVSLAITGTVLDQLERHSPEALDLFAELVGTGCCELLGETYYHSLASVYSPGEFAEQIEMHAAKTRALFGVTPRVFRNTELIYSNELGRAIAAMTDDRGRPRFDGCLCEGVDEILGDRLPDRVYSLPSESSDERDGEFGLLLKNHRLSDDIAFRFGLPVDEYAARVRACGGDGERRLCNLFMDYETFGEHHRAESGVFEFLRDLPAVLLGGDDSEGVRFLTPSEALRAHAAADTYDVPAYSSWADTERDLSAWSGNGMQRSALEEVYKLEARIKDRIVEAKSLGDPQRAAAAGYLLDDWRRLTTSDHFYYMCTKSWSDGAVHESFSPYESPYEGFINYMNVLESVRARLDSV